MLSFKVLSTALLIFMVVCGCSSKPTQSHVENNINTSSSIPVTEKGTAKKEVSLNQSEVFELLKKASQLKEIIISNKPYSKKEIYDYYDKYFTRNYVDKIILGNMKQEGDKWVVANPESELKEGSYFGTNFNDQTKIDQTKGTVTVINKLEDGLYPAHVEQISLIYTNDTWKIDNLLWM